MSLPSLFQRFRRGFASGQPTAADAVPLSHSDVEATRVRARRRVVGMVVLVGAGVIGFPWLFETQPRPMAGDVQIVQAPSQTAADGGAPAGLAVSSPRSVSGKVAVAGIVEAPPAVPEAPAAVAHVDPHEEFVDEPVKPAASHPAASVKPSAIKASEKASAKAVSKDNESPKASAKPAAKEAVKPASKDVAAKTSAKAADKPADKASDKAATRYVVQFGAFADVNTAHEARMKVERLGIKTYTQQVDTPGGKRIRVRMGPYADKAEADKAMATLRKAGLTGAVLTL
jgi:DedD protein